MPHRNHKSEVQRYHTSPLGRAFGDLKVRPKLMVLHNLFFLVLASAVYFSLIPVFENRIGSARDREAALVRQIFIEDRPFPRLPGMEIYGYREGSADELEVPEHVRLWLVDHPGAVIQSPDQPDYLYKKADSPDAYRVVRLPHAFYDNIMHFAKTTLLVVLGLTYILAVLLLELIIMPFYVYRPIRLMLDADEATRHGDRDNEIIDEGLILGDEIGQIMRSRNASIAELRKQEDRLASALKQLEEVNEDLKRKNHLLETAKRNLADQDRLVSLGLLSASVAHELNTPLAVLQGSIEKLTETVPDPNSQDRLARMMRVAQRLRKISESLVDFARVRRQEMEPVPLKPLIEESWSLVAIDEKAADVRFSSELDAGDIVIGSADRLAQVFVNLLRNALNAVASGSRIVVRSRRIDLNGRPGIAICVDDDGPGIPPDVLPDIFEAFVTSRLDARGTGLGLTVAEGIIHQHGGSIIAVNRPEGGARLEVRLPAAAKTAAVEQQ